MLTIGSLFSGIGGLERGLERAGLGPVLWQVENEPFCAKVLAKHWPDAQRHGDVRAIEALPYVDLICGGFPCIDISNAGKRKGITGEHSSLWFEMARLVRVGRPRYVLIENVSAILGRGLDAVLTDLAACGYDAVWDCVPAAAVGAPHRRDRLFLVAWRVSETKRDGVRDEPERGQGAPSAPDRRNPFAIALGAALADRDGGRRQSVGLSCEQGQPGQPCPRGDELDGCSGEDVADAETTRPRFDDKRKERARGRSVERDSGQLEHTDGARPQGEAQRDMGQGCALPTRGCAVSPVANADADEQARKHEERRRHIASPGAGCFSPHLTGTGLGPRGPLYDEWPAFPPGPDDVHAWRRVPHDAQPSVCRLADELSDGLLRDRRAKLSALGNAVVPAVAEVVGRVVLQIERGEWP